MNKLKIVKSCESCNKQRVCSIRESRQGILDIVEKGIYNSSEILEFSSSCQEWDNGVKTRGGLL